MLSKSATAGPTARSGRQRLNQHQQEHVMPKGSTFARVGFVLGLAAAIVGWKSPAIAETITVTHWGGQFYGVPYAVAMEKGFFKKNGVDVTGILTAAGGGTAVRNTLP